MFPTSAEEDVSTTIVQDINKRKIYGGHISDYGGAAQQFMYTPEGKRTLFKLQDSVLHLNPKKKNMYNLYKSLDKDADGYLSYEEFSKSLEKDY